MVAPPDKRIIRQANREDVIAYYGRDVPFTLTAWVGEVEDEPVAIVGLAHVAGRVVAFFDIKEEARIYKKEIWAALKKHLTKIQESGKYRYIFAACDPDEPNAPRLLRYFGFEPTDDDTNIWRWSK